jgi:hypothetical protein
LTLGLLRQGWSSVSDDAVLLRRQPEGVVAVVCRKHCYVDVGTAARDAEPPFGEVASETYGGWKRRVRLDEVSPGQQMVACLPRVLLFARIVSAPQSTVHPLDHVRALKYLLAQSGPQLFDRHTMAPHLEVLKQLMQQTTCYELHAGRDLYQQPGRLGHLLAEATGEAQWRG